MKILHIYDTSGSASIMAYYQRKLGHTVHVITKQSMDKFGISAFYNTTLYDADSLSFYLYAIRQARNYDVLHVHSLVRIAPYLKMLYPRKKMILQFHGSDLRIHGNSNKTKLAILMSDACLITTRDLYASIPVHYETSFAECLNVPDTDIFKHDRIEQNGKWLTFIESGKWHNNAMTDLSLKDVTVIDRTKKHIPFYMMPSLFRQFEGYIDIKIFNGQIIESLSKTGLEALSMGLKVMNWKGEILTELPKEHYPEYQAKQLDIIYKDFNQWKQEEFGRGIVANT